MYRLTMSISLATSVFLASSCVIDNTELPELDQSSSAVISWNVISWNVISWNVISWNVISWNAIASGRLGSHEIQYQPLPVSIKGTPEGRQLIEYLARCSLAPTDTLIVEHNGTTYEYPGRLALAPSWEHQALNSDQQRLISACLIAHINALGESVPISTRVFGSLQADSTEIADFPVFEGAFFGQVFEADQKMFSCQGDSEELALEQSPDRDRRLCTDDDDTCAVVSVGRCRDVCERHDAKYGWTDCWADGVKYAQTVNVFLAADDPADTQTCAADSACSASCSGTDDCTGHMDCQDTATCATQCINGAFCNVDCNGSATCSQYTAGSSNMALDCQLTGNCQSTCMGQSKCEIDCGSATQCNGIVCMGNSECLLDCTDAQLCGFAYCSGQVQTCPGDIVVCNRPCP